MKKTRREFLATTGGLAAMATLGTACSSSRKRSDEPEKRFKVSLAEWSLHRTLRGGELDHLDFPKTARNDFDIHAIEYVNSFFKERARDEEYLRDMSKRADDYDVKSLLIMIDGEGQLGHQNVTARRQAVENHFKWIDAAAYLGCHSIRVNAAGSGPLEEHARHAAESLNTLASYGGPRNVNVIVENHGGPSSNGAWLAKVMKLANHPRVGTLPDFGNFNLGDGETYDRYQGVAELMPWAKAVSAKSHEFDAEGNEIHTDYARMLSIVKDGGYRGWIGVEYEGGAHSEAEGIRLTKALLDRILPELE